MILSPATSIERVRFSVEKAVVVLASVLYLFVALLAIMKAQSGLAPNFALPIIIGLLPMCAFFAFRYPMIFPFALYLVMLPFDALLQVSGGGATIGRFVAIATAGTMVLHALLLRRAYVPHRSWYFWLGYTMYLAASLLWTSDQANGILITLTVLQLFGFMTILAIYPATRAEFMVALWLLVGCGLVAALFAIQQYASGNTSSGGTRVDITLGGKFAIDFNYFAASFILPIAIAMCFTFFSRRLFARIAAGGATLVLMAGLLVTGSRGAFIAAIAIFIYFGIRSKYRVQVGAFVALIGMVTLLFPTVYARFANDPSGQQGSASGRTFIWQTGLYSIRDHFLLGSGVGSYQLTYDRNFINVYQASFQGWSRPSHSILVGGVTELGIVGLLILLATWYVSFRQLKIIPKTSEWFGLRLALEGSIVALFTMSLSIDPTMIKYIWLAHSIALMLLNQAVPRVLRLERSPLRTLAPAPIAAASRRERTPARVR